MLFYAHTHWFLSGWIMSHSRCIFCWKSSDNDPAQMSTRKKSAGKTPRSNFPDAFRCVAEPGAAADKRGHLRHPRRAAPATEAASSREIPDRSRDRERRTGPVQRLRQPGQPLQLGVPPVASRRRRFRAVHVNGGNRQSLEQTTLC